MNVHDIGDDKISQPQCLKQVFSALFFVTVATSIYTDEHTLTQQQIAISFLVPKVEALNVLYPSSSKSTQSQTLSLLAYDIVFCINERMCIYTTTIYDLWDQYIFLQVLNQIVIDLPPDHPLSDSTPLRELLGHTPLQVNELYKLQCLYDNRLPRTLDYSETSDDCSFFKR